MPQPKTRVIWSSKIKISHYQEEQANGAVDANAPPSKQITPQLEPSELTADYNGTNSFHVLSKDSAEARGAAYHQVTEDVNISYGQKMNVSQLLPLIQSHSPSTFVTLTDITQEQIIVEEINVQSLLNNNNNPKSDVLNSILPNPNSKYTNKLNGCYKNTAADDDSDESTSGSDEFLNDDIYEIENKSDKFVHYICPQCGENCVTLLKWQRHTEIEHNFGSIDMLNMSSSINEVGKLLRKCCECEYSSIDATYHTLLGHRIRHMPYRKYIKCKLCQMSFYREGNLTLHLRYKHIIILKDILNKPQGKHGKYKEYIIMRCPLCLIFVANEEQFYDHLDKHDYISKIKSKLTTNIGSTTCNLCSFKLNAQSNRTLISHMLSHEPSKSYNCGYCNNFATTKRNNLLVHLKYVHFKSAEIKCVYCNEYFKTEKDCFVHYHSFHKIRKAKSIHGIKRNTH